MARLIQKFIDPLMIKEAPSYANKFFYSLGFLSMISFVMLIITGVVMSFYGPNWWLTTTPGQYLRSVHMWATQAFVLFVLLHLAIVFFTSGFKKPRQLTWVLGILMLLLLLAESEFGFVLRGDFSSQWRALQGADFYNGGGLGYWLNTLNYKQIYGIHIVVVPMATVALLFGHYLLVRILGVAKPYRKDVVRKTVPANHTLLFARGGSVAAVVLLLALVFPSPYLKPVTIQEVSQSDPALMAQTLVSEFDHSSDTATYKDNIDPYPFDTQTVFVSDPYAKLVRVNQGMADQMAVFNTESQDTQTAQLKTAADFYKDWHGDTNKFPAGNPVFPIVSSLITMAEQGLYEPALAAANSTTTPADDTTYTLRFLSDTGVLEDEASSLNMTTEQYGMLREEKHNAPGAWWLAPIGVLNHTVLSGDDNGDRDAAIIFGSFFLLLLAFPFIPYLNQLPDRLRVYKLIWHEPKAKKTTRTKR
jgi:ubiquinol-cytochrome c reductase cytochrome b subunit